MATSGHVLQGLRSPRALILSIATSLDVPSLASSVVAAVSLRVERGDDSEEAWTCTVVSQAAELLVVAHPWSAGENDTAGETLRIYAQLTTAGGVLECEAATVTVRPR